MPRKRIVKIALAHLESRKNLTSLLTAAILLVWAGGCRSTKTIHKAISVPRKDTVIVVSKPAADTSALVKEDLKGDSLRFISQSLNALSKNYIDFSTFSARVKVNYEGADGSSNTGTAYIHIKKDSMIWVSINAGLGIEAFRMLITPDSVKILERFKKVARLRSVSYLKQEIHLPLNFTILQDLLIGNPVFLDTSNISFYKKDRTNLSLMSIGQLFKNYITLNANDNTMIHSKLDDTNPMSARTCDLTYGDYDQRGNIKFSTSRRISVAEKSKLDIEMDFKQYSFNEVLSFSFSIPKNYKRK